MVNVVHLKLDDRLYERIQLEAIRIGKRTITGTIEFMVLHYLDEKEKQLAELARVTHPEGKSA